MLLKPKMIYFKKLELSPHNLLDTSSIVSKFAEKSVKTWQLKRTSK